MWCGAVRCLSEAPRGLDLLAKEARAEILSITLTPAWMTLICSDSLFPFLRCSSAASERLRGLQIAGIDGTVGSGNAVSSLCDIVVLERELQLNLSVGEAC